jgi:5-histidylcysteine sulfoxide synthase/putative 4-mercaptohistidine N1-methyltranferase
MQVCKTPTIDVGDSEQKRAEIKEYFNVTFDTYESLYATLAGNETYYQRPEPLRHPLIFYLGHTATFFVNKLIVSRLLEHRIDPRLESMMAIGVDEMSWDDLDDQHYDWPPVDEVYAYRNKVRDLVNRMIDVLPISLPIQWQDPFWIILMGIEHERIHLETSSVLIRQLPLDQVRANDHWPICDATSASAPDNQLLPVEGGMVNQGRGHGESRTYGWDNEYGSQESRIEPFKASQFLVSNQEFLAFMADGGYGSREWWTEEGQQWLDFKQQRSGDYHPVFWVPENDGGYKYRTMLEEIDMPWDWPVDVNYLEAKAFCNWLSARKGKSIRLPTEAEWYRLYDSHISEDHVDWSQAPGNINLEHWASSAPVNRFMQGDFGDIVGNVWQWTETAIDGFEGFQVHPAYDDFSVPTFDGRHNLIKGGSWISTGNEALRDSRYAFRRHFFQHAGFRYVESGVQVEETFNTYETDEQISMYLEFHYGDEYFNVPNFPKACVDTLIDRTGVTQLDRVLDVGCAVGRSSFELARIAHHVDAVDFSTRFIRNALNLREHGQVRYLITDEGELTSLKVARLDELGIADNAGHVEFSQGDACNLKPIYQGYDLIFAGNLIDRLYEPALFLQDMHQRINAGGFLVLTSPYTWLEEFTAKQHWLGGFKENGENLTTLAGIRRSLAPHFEPLGEPVDVPFVIRETARKHQHTVAQLSIWRRS